MNKFSKTKETKGKFHNRNMKLLYVYWFKNPLSASIRVKYDNIELAAPNVLEICIKTTDENNFLYESKRKCDLVKPILTAPRINVLSSDIS